MPIFAPKMRSTEAPKLGGVFGIYSMGVQDIRGPHWCFNF